MGEHRRQAVDPASIPALQVNNIDFSYGNVQVLFDVNFEVRRGECVALLGTNGAGKSTILRVISRPRDPRPRRGAPQRPQHHLRRARESRTRLGIVQLPGGKGVFPSLTVAQNLEMSASAQRRHAGRDRRPRRARARAVPRARRAPQNQPARSLSGGQQQMLALGTRADRTSPRSS